jgi:hypothetical protein
VVPLQLDLKCTIDIEAHVTSMSQRTVYSRLFEDSERQHQKLEEDKRKIEQAKQEALGRQKIKISKVTQSLPFSSCVSIMVESYTGSGLVFLPSF